MSATWGGVRGGGWVLCIENKVKMRLCLRPAGVWGTEDIAEYTFKCRKNSLRNPLDRELDESQRPFGRFCRHKNSVLGGLEPNYPVAGPVAQSP